MMDVITIAGVSGVIIGVGLSCACLRGWLLREHNRAQAWRKQVQELQARLNVTAQQNALYQDCYGMLDKQLHALRSNCFLTNERGHRVRYSKASAKVRAKAEGMGE